MQTEEIARDAAACKIRKRKRGDERTADETLGRRSAALCSEVVSGCSSSIPQMKTNKQTNRGVTESSVELRIMFLATIYFLVGKVYNVSFQVSCALLSQLTMAV